MKLLNFFKKESKGKNFFELPSKEKKQIIKRAVRGSNDLQLELAKRYAREFSA